MAVGPKRVSSHVTAFHIDTPDATLADLAVRLDRTRFPDEVDLGRSRHGRPICCDDPREFFRPPRSAARPA
jgi:hypothetical protein